MTHTPSIAAVRFFAASALVASLGLGWPNPPDLADPDYDDVFVVVPRSGQPASVVDLTCGRPTP